MVVRLLFFHSSFFCLVNCDPDKSGIWENLFSVWSEFIKVMNRHFIPLQTFKSFPQDVFPIFLCGFYVVVAREVQDGGATKCCCQVLVLIPCVNILSWPYFLFLVLLIISLCFRFTWKISNKKWRLCLFEN